MPFGIGEGVRQNSSPPGTTVGKSIALASPRDFFSLEDDRQVWDEKRQGMPLHFGRSWSIGSHESFGPRIDVIAA